MYDVIVIGGGPAGMTAALYAQRNGKNALVIEKAGFGGQITHSPKVENYPGTYSMSGNEFADHTLDQILRQGAEIEIAEAVEVRDEGAKKVVVTEDGTEFEGKTVVIASGVKHRMLGLEGEEKLVGEGISFCAVCDGDFYAGKTVVVAGGGNSALQEAILLAEKCKKVILLQDLPAFTGEAKLQEVLFSKPNVEGITDTRILRLVTEGERLTGVEFETRSTSSGKRTVLCDGLFVAIGLIPENKPFSPLADLNEYGYFDSDESCVTKTPGVFVAGDCRSKRIRQVATAIADGAVAALAACRYIDMM